MPVSRGEAWSSTLASHCRVGGWVLLAEVHRRLRLQIWSSTCHSRGLARACQCKIIVSGLRDSNVGAALRGVGEWEHSYTPIACISSDTPYGEWINGPKMDVVFLLC